MDDNNIIKQPELILVTEEPRGPSQLIEIQVTTATSPIKWPSTDELISDDVVTIILKGMRLITDKVLAIAPSGAINAPLAELVNISIIIQAEGWIKGQTIPILTLNDMADADATAATTIPYRAKPTTKFNSWRRVEWNKCLLVWSAGTAPTPPFSVCMEIEYERLNTKGGIIYGPA